MDGTRTRPQSFWGWQAGILTSWTTQNLQQFIFRRVNKLIDLKVTIFFQTSFSNQCLSFWGHFLQIDKMPRSFWAGVFWFSIIMRYDSWIEIFSKSFIKRIIFQALDNVNIESHRSILVWKQKSLNFFKLRLFLRNGRDSNPRPPAWQAGILTSWTTTPFVPL